MIEIYQYEDWIKIRKQLDKLKIELPDNQIIKIRTFSRNIEEYFLTIRKLEIKYRQTKKNYILEDIDQMYETINNIVPLLMKDISHQHTIALLKK